MEEFTCSFLSTKANMTYFRDYENFTHGIITSPPYTSKMIYLVQISRLFLESKDERIGTEMKGISEAASVSLLWWPSHILQADGLTGICVLTALEAGSSRSRCVGRYRFP